MIRSEELQLFLHLATISYFNVNCVHTPLLLAVACELMFFGVAAGGGSTMQSVKAR